jgi:hypothetical protein
VISPRGDGQVAPAEGHLPRWGFPLAFAMLAVGIVLGGLLVGYEPVGGDPDRLYRPLKAELARALRAGRLPFWSDRFGLGVPLVAESHVAAFYPPNLLMYRYVDVSTAYRISMWLHYVALAAATFSYARSLGVLPWGSALAACSFSLCGFFTIHSSHEPFYQLMPYLPLALALAERFMATGKAAWLVLVSLALGLQWTLGHFQIQTWTTGLVVLTGLLRAALDRRHVLRAAALVGAAGLGAALAAVQLGLSWQYAAVVGQTERSVADRFFYSFPPAHWFELAVPRVVRELRLGPEDPYWFSQQTTGYEAALYVGTIPLILAIASCCAFPFKRESLLWRLLVPASFALATMPRWWPEGYAQLLALPGVGYFRVPARYTLLTSLGLAILAGEGLDRSIPRGRFRLGLMTALVLGIGAGVAAWHWSRQPGVRLASVVEIVPDGILWALLTWAVALGVVMAWRHGRIAPWVLTLAAAVELGVLFHAGTTQWGWSIALPEGSPVLSELARRSERLMVGGQTENLPVRAGMATAYPYLGFAHPMATRLLEQVQRPLFAGEGTRAPDEAELRLIKGLLKRFRVTHLIGYSRAIRAVGRAIGTWRDPALDQIVYRAPTEAESRAWTIVELEPPGPEARVAVRARMLPDARALLERLASAGDDGPAFFLSGDNVRGRPDAQGGRLISWDGSEATVEHDGPCDLVLARTYDAGWRARIDGTPEQAVLPVDGGLIAVRLQGSGTQHVRLRYRPQKIVVWAGISLVALAIEVAIVAAALVRATRRTKRRDEVTGSASPARRERSR